MNWSCHKGFRDQDCLPLTSSDSPPLIMVTSKKNQVWLDHDSSKPIATTSVGLAQSSRGFSFSRTQNRKQPSWMDPSVEPNALANATDEPIDSSPDIVEDIDGHSNSQSQ